MSSSIVCKFLTLDTSLEVIRISVNSDFISRFVFSVNLLEEINLSTYSKVLDSIPLIALIYSSLPVELPKIELFYFIFTFSDLFSKLYQQQIVYF
jgi:hypothetical protein